MANLWGCITQPCPNKIIGFSNKSLKGLQQIVLVFLEKFIYQKLENVPKKIIHSNINLERGNDIQFMSLI
jgi:hypothetical protein